MENNNVVAWITCLIIIIFTICHDKVKKYYNNKKLKKSIKKELDNILITSNSIIEEFNLCKKDIDDGSEKEKIYFPDFDFYKINLYNLSDIYSNEDYSELMLIICLMKKIKKGLPYKQMDEYYKIINNHKTKKHYSNGIFSSECEYNMPPETTINCCFCNQVKNRFIKSFDISIENIENLKLTKKKFNSKNNSVNKIFYYLMIPIIFIINYIIYLIFS